MKDGRWKMEDLRNFQKWSLRQPIINQQINVSTNQRINKSTYQQINVSTNQRINKSTYQRINVPTYQQIRFLNFNFSNACAHKK